MPFGEPIVLKSVGTRTEFGADFIDIEIDRNMNFAISLQKFIMVSVGCKKD